MHLQASHFTCLPFDVTETPRQALDSVVLLRSFQNFHPYVGAAPHPQWGVGTHSVYDDGHPSSIYTE